LILPQLKRVAAVVAVEELPAAVAVVGAAQQL
jgi:hypothetical protein